MSLLKRSINFSSFWRKTHYNTSVVAVSKLHQLLRTPFVIWSTTRIIPTAPKWKKLDCCLCTVNHKEATEILHVTAYNNVAEETLESLSDYFEELITSNSSQSDADVTLGNGVLTVKLGSGNGTYVINKQTPNRQIWLSSPISGPKRYDLVSGQWVYRHDGLTLHQLLNEEMKKIFGDPVDFSQCSHAKKS